MNQVFCADRLIEIFAIEESMVQTLVDEFRATLPVTIEQIRQARDVSDYRALEIASHSLKSSCALLGFEKAAAYCYQMELESSQKIPASGNLEVLSSFISEALFAFDSYMQARAV